MYGVLDISVSGMIAQRTRQASIAANFASKDVLLNSNGQLEPYRARRVFFSPGDPSATTPFGRAMGVHVAAIEEDQSPVQWKSDPFNPMAATSGPHKGEVPMPNVNPVVEEVNMMEASRAYEANVAAAEVTKSMISQALRMLA
jgi:flagellar basal-body rod protein FlgC